MPATILVIDDDDLIRELILEILSLEDYRLISAINGQEGLELALESQPDLIVSDVIMPYLDGYQMLTILRNNPLTENIPVILLTSQLKKENQRQGMELGADDYLTKPFTPKELLQAIKTRLKRQEIAQKKSQDQLDFLRKSISMSLPHEFRTPLNGIIGSTQLLQENWREMNPDDVDILLQSLYDSSQRLYHLIQNFLLYSQLELLQPNTEKTTYFLEGKTLFPSGIITNIITKKNIFYRQDRKVICELVDHPLPILEKWLDKILDEIIDNAFKFSSVNSCIHIKTNIEKNYYNIEVIDYGRGIKPEDIKKIGAYLQFDRHYYEQQGSGLGLCIAKRLVELYQGNFSIDSILNQMTLVKIQFPLTTLTKNILNTDLN